MNRVHPGALALLVLAACDDGKDSGDTGPALAGPVMTHTPPSTGIEGEPVDLAVTAVDEDGVANVTLFFRTTGEDDWANLPMEQGDDDAWTATVEGDAVAAPGLDYYFHADDANEATPASSYLPETSTAAPFTLDVAVEGRLLPFDEPFELTESQAGITALGWANASEGFRGYGWEADADLAHDGTYAVYHSRGYSGTDPMEDWLISPPLDLRAVDSAQVVWWEYGSGVDLAAHALWVSLGSRDPADGDWVLLAELAAPPEDAWGRAEVVDLAPYVGQSPVYLAWVYSGVDADAWWIDDVRVSVSEPWLETAVAVDPSPLSPGESGSLVVSLTNDSAVDASDVSVTVAFPEGGASVGSATTTLAALAAGGTDSVSFALAIDAATGDNRYLPVELTWAAGDLSTTETTSLLVGYASTAEVVFTPAGTGDVEIVVGVGDPDAPTWEATLYDDEATDVLELSLDVTDQWAYLPPTADGRWWVRVDAAAGGTLDLASLSWDGQDYAASVLPAISAGEDAYAWIPSPPDLAVTATTRPTTLEPGTAAAQFVLVVTNSGEATQGDLVATLSSTDPDVALQDGGPITLGPLGAGESLTVSDVFSFDVAAAHIDSSDVEFTLTLADELDTWDIPVTLDVPWPVFRVIATDISGDGILDPGESADLVFTLANRGDLGSDGALSAHLSVESTSTASATLSTNTESFSVVDAGEQEENSDEWTITVDGGADGDTVDLLLTLTDARTTYEARTSLTLGEPPWNAISGDDDPAGDALDGWEFDLAGGSYRVVDDVLQLELQSYTAFDPSGLFIEIWGQSDASDWSYHRLVLQSGVATMQGYDAGFVELTEPTVSYPDAFTVRFDIDTTALGLAINRIDLGFATGWCGPDEYFCDHWPDGWGYPYYSFSMGNWYTLSWR